MSLVYFVMHVRFKRAIRIALLLYEYLLRLWNAGILRTIKKWTYNRKNLWKIINSCANNTQLNSFDLTLFFARWSLKADLRSRPDSIVCNFTQFRHKQTAPPAWRNVLTGARLAVAFGRIQAIGIFSRTICQVYSSTNLPKQDICISTFELRYRILYEFIIACWDQKICRCIWKKTRLYGM